MGLGNTGTVKHQKVVIGHEGKDGKLFLKNACCKNMGRREYALAYFLSTVHYSN